jgi:hypothetical protein
VKGDLGKLESSCGSCCFLEVDAQRLYNLERNGRVKTLSLFGAVSPSKLHFLFERIERSLHDIRSTRVRKLVRFSDWLNIDTLFRLSSLSWLSPIGFEIGILFEYSVLFHSHFTCPSLEYSIKYYSLEIERQIRGMQVIFISLHRIQLFPRFK